MIDFIKYLPLYEKNLTSFVKLSVLALIEQYNEASEIDKEQIEHKILELLSPTSPIIDFDHTWHQAVS